MKLPDQILAIGLASADIAIGFRVLQALASSKRFCLPSCT